MPTTSQRRAARPIAVAPRPPTLGEDTAEESRSLLDLSVNADWDETAAELDDIGAVTDERRSSVTLDGAVRPVLYRRKP